MDGGALGSRSFVATAATQDTAAGSSVVVTVTNTPTGASPPAVPDTFTLRYVDDAGTIIESVTLSNTTTPQTDTFFFTTNGLTGGAARAGTVEIKLQATKTTGGPTNTYDVETDGAPNTPPTGFTTTQLDRGWIRGTTTLTQAISNISLGGGKSSPAQYDESLFVRTTCGHLTYLSRSLTVALSNGGPSGSTNATTAAQRDITFANVCDNRFPAASTTITMTVTVPNATLTGVPAFTFTSTTTDSIAVDPRLTATPLFQLDSNTWATPPLSQNSAAHLRRTDQQGFLGNRMTGARGVGINGITWTMTLTPTLPGTTITNTGVVSAAQGGQDGWGGFTAWSSALPGGTWTKAITVTAPADIVGSTYLTQTDTAYSLIAFNSNLRVIGTSNRPAAETGSGARHMEPGQQLSIIAHVVDRSTNIRVPGAQISNVRCSFLRNNPNQALPGTGNGRQYLSSDTDNTSAAWTTWDPALAATSYTLSVSAADSTVFERVFSATAGWAYRDIVIGLSCEIGGATYNAEIQLELTGIKNRHDANAFDPTGLFQ